MYRYSVGDHYFHGVDRVEPATNYNFRGGEHELLLICENLRDTEVADVRSGDTRFGFLVFENVIFFLYRFGSSMHWSDCPFSIWRVPEVERVSPEVAYAPETRALLNIILVRAENNTIEALRAVSLSPAVTRQLHAAILQQLRQPLGDAAYKIAIASAYQRWPQTAAMVPFAQTCGGGE